MSERRDIERCLVIGIDSAVPARWREFFMIGVCGGYTTFSSFSLQTLNLVQEGEWLRAGANTIASVVPNCISICTFPGWSIPEMTQIVRAATGWDVSDYELYRVGERALNLARVFNTREGFTVDDDHLAERSYGPTIGGALRDGGIDREELREAVHNYYAMMGWEKETGVPKLETLQDLGVEWAAGYLK